MRLHDVVHESCHSNFFVSIPSIAGQLSKPVETVPGFQMHSEDFPALPGTSTKASGKWWYVI